MPAARPVPFGGPQHDRSPESTSATVLLAWAFPGELRLRRCGSVPHSLPQQRHVERQIYPGGRM